MSYTDLLVDLFQSRPGEKFDGLALARIAGAYAWRTRVSEARTRLRAAGLGDIVNEQSRTSGGRCQSVYWFEPARPGRLF